MKFHNFPDIASDMKHTIVELRQMDAIVFEGFGPGCEMKAFGEMKEWIGEQQLKEYRIFGYNIDPDGKLTYDPRHEGYRVLLVSAQGGKSFAGMKIEIIAPGKFLVLHAEGNLQNIDTWMPEAWMAMNRTVQDQNLKVKEPPRWFEEHIRSTTPGCVNVKLYLELA